MASGPKQLGVARGEVVGLAFEPLRDPGEGRHWMSPSVEEQDSPSRLADPAPADAADSVVARDSARALFDGDALGELHTPTFRTGR